MNRENFRVIPEIAERQVSRFKGEYRKVLLAQAREAAAAIREGLSADALPGAFLDKWTRELAEFKARAAIRFGIEGYKLAGVALGKKAFVRAMAKERLLDINIDTSAFGADELVANQLKPHVSAWVEETSRIETETTAAKMQRTIREAFKFQEENGFGVTPRDIATAFLEKEITDSESRAEMLTRTLTNWSYNEGAMTLYEAEGITESEWLTTLDEVTGEWDRELDGTRVRMRDNFVAQGDTFTQEDGSVVTAGIDVPHPPLRPNCRCGLVPVVA